MSEPLRILDTDHISLHQRGHESVLAHIAALDPARLAVTVVSLEESMRGWLAVVRRAQDATALERGYRYLQKDRTITVNAWYSRLRDHPCCNIFGCVRP